MTAGPPPLTAQDIRAEPAQFAVLLGPEGGAWPTRANEVDYLIPTRVSRSSGSERLDSLSFTWDLGRSGHRLVDAQTPVGHNRIADVHRVNPRGGLTRESWGLIAEQSHYLDRSRELVHVTTRIDSWLIGAKKTTGYWVHHSDDSRQFVNRAIVFNPEIGGKLYGNRAISRVGAVHWFLDPGSVQSGPARTLHTTAEPSRLWTLAHVVHSLCWLLNDDETYVTNPTLTQLQTELRIDVIADEDVIRNLRLRFDLSLGQCLDAVLQPHGFGWSLKHGDAIPGPDSEFSFYRRNVGAPLQAFLQRPGERIDRVNTNISEYHANISIADLTNRMDGLTSPLRVESTFELWPAWLYDPLNLTPTTLSVLNQTEWRLNGSEFRTFALNEAGDLTDTRPGITEAEDLNAILTEPDAEGDARLLPYRRRAFLPAITLAPNREPIGNGGYELQFKRRWYDTEDPPEEQEDEWKTVDWPFEVLDDQCGIRLTGQVEPELYRTLVDFPDDSRPLRLTASVESDFSRHNAAERRADSPNGNDVTTVLDLGSRFHMRKVDSTSEHYAPHHLSITAVAVDLDGGSGSFGVASIDTDVTPVAVGDRVLVSGSTANDGAYTVASVAGSQVIVDEPVEDATVDGTMALFTDSADDTAQMQEYLEHLRDVDDAADVSCSVVLDGVDHTEYQIGKLVTKVDGRNLNLSGTAAGVTPARNLQIVGVSLELDGQQQMEITLESFRVERFDFTRDA